jgi:hypothetical protein
MAASSRMHGRGRGDGKPVTDRARGNARAAARRARQVLRRSCQSGCGESPAGAWSGCRTRTSAGLTDMRFHDMRHTCVRSCSTWA